MAGRVPFERGVDLITVPRVEAACLEAEGVQHRVRTPGGYRLGLRGQQETAPASPLSIRVLNPELIDIEPPPPPSPEEPPDDLT